MRRTHSDFYFSDFALASGLDTCRFCGDVVGLSELRHVQLDVEDEGCWVCTPCLEAYDRAHLTP